MKPIISRKALSIHYGNTLIDFQVLYQHRKTLEIAVTPDATVQVKAPFGTPTREIVQRVTHRARWIHQQCQWFRQFHAQSKPKGYIGGETHCYLGRQYRLKIKPHCNEESIKLVRGFFLIHCKTVPDEQLSKKVKSLLGGWLRSKAHYWFQQLLNDTWQQNIWQSCKKPKLQIRQMVSRWGSLSEKGTMTLNMQLIEAPRECIEYVIQHELCHLKERNHSPAFYNQLEQLMPDWQKRKLKLEQLSR